MNTIGEDDPVVHKLYFFPVDIESYAKMLQSSAHDDNMFSIFFTLDAGVGELPALAVDIIEYIQDSCKKMSACLHILSFAPVGQQFVNMIIDARNVNIQHIVKMVNDVDVNDYAYMDWLENPSKPSLITDSPMNATYIEHLMKLLLLCDISVREIDGYVFKKNPLGA